MSGQTVGQSAPVVSIAVCVRDLLRRVAIVVLMLFASVHAVDAQPAVLTGLGVGGAGHTVPEHGC